MSLEAALAPGKAKMLNKDEAVEHTGHAVGGVCPFGLKKPIEVYLDVSLQKHVEIIPAAGDRYSRKPRNLK